MQSTRREFLKSATTVPLMGLGGELTFCPGDDGQVLRVYAASGDCSSTYRGRALEEWLAEFHNAGSPQKADRAAHVLSLFGKDAVGPLVQAISTVQAFKRSRVVACVADMGRDAVPALLTLLEHPDTTVRTAACVGLAYVTTDDDLIPPGIAAATYYDLWQSLMNEPREKWATAFDKADQAMTRTDDGMRQATDEKILAALTARLDDSYREVRVAAIEAMTQVRCPQDSASSVLIALVHALDDPDEDVRIRAAQALRDGMPALLTTFDEQCLLRLLKALDDPVAGVRKAVLSILHERQVSDSLQIAALLRSESATEVDLGPRATCELMALVPETIPVLLATLFDPRPEIRACAAGAIASANRYLGWVHGRREKAVNALTNLLDDEHPAVRLAALHSLATIRKPSWPDVDDILSRSLEHHDPAVRREVVALLGSCDSESTGAGLRVGEEGDLVLEPERAQVDVEALPADATLLAWLHGRDIAVRLAAVKIVCESRPVENRAVAALIGALYDSCREVQRHAELALRLLCIEKAAASGS